jgi:hypothetical protein
MSSDNIQLNQNYVQRGTGTLTFVVPTTGNYNVKCQCTVPSALITGAGSGSARDNGLGANGGVAGINGGTGLGFGGSTNDNATGYSTGYGAGAGGGDAAGMARGGLGTSDGAVGQGFGPNNSGYQQPPTDIHSSQTTGPAVSSGLVVTILDGVTLLYTSPTLSPTQSSLEFKYSLQATAADSITIVFTSSNASDANLVANVSIGQGL